MSQNESNEGANAPKAGPSIVRHDAIGSRRSNEEKNASESNNRLSSTNFHPDTDAKTEQLFAESSRSATHDVHEAEDGNEADTELAPNYVPSNRSILIPPKARLKVGKGLTDENGDEIHRAGPSSSSGKGGRRLNFNLDPLLPSNFSSGAEMSPRSFRITDKDRINAKRGSLRPIEDRISKQDEFISDQNNSTRKDAESDVESLRYPKSPSVSEWVSRIKRGIGAGGESSSMAISKQNQSRQNRSRSKNRRRKSKSAKSRTSHRSNEQSHDGDSAFESDHDNERIRRGSDDILVTMDSIEGGRTSFDHASRPPAHYRLRRHCHLLAA